MIDYIKPHPEGFIVVHCFLDIKRVRSDLNYIKSLIYEYKDGSVLKPIKTIQRNNPIYINEKIILLAVPNKQSTFRNYINLIEIQEISLKNRTLVLRFYSGNSLEIHLKNQSIYKRVGQLLDIIDHGF